MTVPPGILWDCSGSPDTQWHVEMKLPTTSQQRAVHQFAGPEPTLGISRQNIRHLYIMGPINSPIGRRCGTQEETAASVLCECETLTSFKHLFGLLSLGPRRCQKSKSEGVQEQGSHDGIRLTL